MRMQRDIDMIVNERYAVIAAVASIMELTFMASLTVRNLDAALVRRLRIQAAENDRSAEAEHREILRQALLPEEKRKPLKELLLEMPAGGEDADFARSPDRGRDVDL